jgi:flavoprotein hydroxylase
MPRMLKEVDVLIVGLGPVGSALGLMLASAPSKPTVACIERHPAPYPLPRAVHLDSEGGRILDAIGALGFGEYEPTGDYVWQSATGELLLKVPMVCRTMSLGRFKQTWIQADLSFVL